MEELVRIKAEVYDLIVAKELRQSEIATIDAMIKERASKVEELSKIINDQVVEAESAKTKKK